MKTSKRNTRNTRLQVAALVKANGVQELFVCPTHGKNIVNVFENEHVETRHDILGLPKSPCCFFHKTKDIFLMFTNNLIDLDI